MKKLCFIVSVFFTGILFSQEINCVEKQKQLSSLINDKDYKQANLLLSEIKTICSSKSEEFFYLGINVLQYNVDIASNETKEKEIRELIKFYDLYDKNFPKNKNGNSINKAMLLFDNGIANQDEIYSNLDKSFQKDKFQFSNPNALFTYFKMFKEKYDDKKNAITFDKFIETYGQVLAVIEKNKTTFPDKSVEFENAKLATNSIVREDFTKENLVSYSENNFKQNANNVEWLSSIAALLFVNASESSIFGAIASQLNSLNPTSKSLYYLADFNLKNKNQEKAIDLLEKSAELSIEKNEKSQIYLTLANMFATRDKSKSKEFIKKIMEISPERGDVYLLLASLYSNSINECATTEIEKKAINRLAKITAETAAKVEPRFKSSLPGIAKKYANQELTADEIKQVKKSGGSITINCWINEKVKF
ncbi:hypothetical protein [Flavobacterium sp.]|uniref:tetratricopeptide repeat protein n=1 Tax=Flavobacterium sp. TaxID=239 RepID=UPI002625BFFF|nr:hypothetical protein [Flavobacterium sp.]